MILFQPAGHTKERKRKGDGIKYAEKKRLTEKGQEGEREKEPGDAVQTKTAFHVYLFTANINHV